MRLGQPEAGRAGGMNGKAEGGRRKAEGAPAARSARQPLPLTRHQAAAVLAAAVLAGCAAASAGRLEAQRIVDRAEPMRCEILAMEARLKEAPPGSGEAAALAAKIEKAKAQLKYHYLATMDEYIAVMKELPFEERKSVYRYSAAVSERCTAARRKSEVESRALSYSRVAGGAASFSRDFRLPTFDFRLQVTRKRHGHSACTPAR
jgi:hypothetical protein